MRRALIAIAAFIVAGLVIVLGPYSDLKTRLGARPPFEEQPARDAEEARAVLETLGPEGRSLYLRQLKVDLVVVAANATWLWIWLRAVGRRALPRKLGIAAPATLASIPALADLAENACVYAIVARHPAISPIALDAAGAATGVKFVSFVLAVVVALVLSAWAGVVRLRARGSTRSTTHTP